MPDGGDRSPVNSFGSSEMLSIPITRVKAPGNNTSVENTDDEINRKTTKLQECKLCLNSHFSS